MLCLGENVIIIIGTTTLFEPRPSLEASASCPYSLQQSSSFSPPTSWRHKTFHEPILKSLNRFVDRRVLDSPAIASLDFSTILFSGAGSDENILLLILSSLIDMRHSVHSRADIQSVHV
jgi:hypothetical protein